MHPLGLMLLLAVPPEPKPHLVLRGHKGAIDWLAASPDGKAVAACVEKPGHGDEVWVWETRTGKRRRAFPGEIRDACVTLGPEGATAAVWKPTWPREAGPGIFLHETERDRRRFLPDHSSGVRVYFSQDGRWFASHQCGGGPSEGRLRNSLRLWDVRNGRRRASLESRGGVVVRVEFSPDGRVMASGNMQGVVTLWELATAKARASFPGTKRAVWVLRFCPRGKVLAVAGGQDGTVRLFDVGRHEPRAVLPGPKLRFNALDAAFSPDGRVLAVGYVNGGVALWEVATGRLRTTLAGAARPTTAVAWAAPGNAVVAKDDGEVRVWSFTDLKVRARIRVRERTVVSRTGNVIARANPDGSVSVWRTEELLKR
jgi:WD40 repeat protein